MRKNTENCATFAWNYTLITQKLNLPHRQNEFRRMGLFNIFQRILIMHSIW